MLLSSQLLLLVPLGLVLMVVGGGGGVAAADIHCNSLDNVVAEACVAAKTINQPQYFHNPVTR